MADPPTYSNPSLDLTNGAFPGFSYTQASVDDIIIFYVIHFIDGPFGIIGTAGPLMIRPSGPGAYLPISGKMEFDSDNFASLSDTTIYQIILREMGRVLGFGTLWHPSFFPCNNGCPSPITFYTCSKAKVQYNAIASCGSGDLPLEVTGGSGTSCVFWLESGNKSLQNELMTRVRGIARIAVAGMV